MIHVYTIHLEDAGDFLREGGEERREEQKKREGGTERERETEEEGREMW